MGQNDTATLAMVAGAAAGATLLLQRLFAAARRAAPKPSSVEPSCDFVLMGVNGFIGSRMLDAVRAAGYNVVVMPSSIRLHQRETLQVFLATNRPRHGVICCSGTRGNPNIDWCDTHPVETIDANVTGQLNVATICKELELHCALVGTGFVYHGIDGKVYTEEDAPDSQLPKAYIKLRIALEQLLAYYPNVLNLRVIYPITRDMSDKRGLVGKLAGFSKVDDAVGCCTFLEDLCPLVPLMMIKKATGPVNFTNRGTVSYKNIVERLKKKNPGYNPELRPLVGRPAIALDCTKMVSLCAPVPVPTADESLDKIFAQS